MKPLFSLFLLSATLLCQTFAGDFKFAGQTLTVPEGFVIELIAGPPLVDRPIAADFDEEGRLYVSDSSGSNEKTDKQVKNPTHRIVRLVDADGDGKFDKATVFADKMMFPEGAMWRHGSFYVGAPPSIWKLTDTHGDGIADIREEWMQGKTLTGCANDLHGPYAGPDGWIYWCKGAFAKQTYERPGQQPFVTRAAHIFRCRPDGTGIEPVMTGGMDNPVEVAFTPTGERIFTTTFFQNPGGGKRDGLVHAIYGGVYGKVHDVIDEHPRTGDVMPVLTHLGAAAPCGLMRFTSDAFGSEYRDNLFTCCFNLHRVERHVLIPDGATYKTKDTEFMTSDSLDFHPTDVLEDADGSLIVLDTGGWYKLCCPTSQLAKPDVLGAIYRIRRATGPKIADPRGLRIPWANLGAGDLAKLLDDSRPFVRRRAIDRLGTLGTSAVPALSETLRKSNSAEAKRNAIWALTRLESAEARAAVRSALGQKDETVRLVALHSISLWRDKEAFASLLPLLKTPEARIKRAAAEALGRIGNSAAIPAILSATGLLKTDDRIMEHSLIFALIEIADAKLTAAGLQSANSRTRHCALIALDQMPGRFISAAEITPLLGSQDALLKETATWIISRHNDWGEPLSQYVENQLKNGKLTEAGELLAQLAQFSKDRAIQDLLSRVVGDATLPKMFREIGLMVMAQSAFRETPGLWVRQITSLLSSSDTNLLQSSIAAARAFALPKAGNADLDAALYRIAENQDVPRDARLEALAAARPLDHLSSELFDFLIASAGPDNPRTTRNNASLVLSKTKLNDAQLLVLADILPQAGPFEFIKLVASFEGCSNEAIGNKLLENLKKSKALSSLPPDVLRTKLSKFPEVVQKNAEEVFTRLNVDSVKQKAHLEELLAQLSQGDVRRGQALFNSPKVACVSCHAMGYLGGQVGPDLTSIGTIRSERDLLESIVYPSASFVRSYEPIVIRNTSGDEFTGILKKDAPDEVVLVTGPEAEVRLARLDVAEMRPGTVSIMPQGLDQQLSQQELSDLVAFLKNTKWGAQ